MSIKKATDKEIIEKCKIALERIRTYHLREWEGTGGNVFFISDEYPAVWMEHAFDSLVWASLSGEAEVAVNETMLFINNQREDGHFPFVVGDGHLGFGQLQECVSFASLCDEVHDMTGDIDYLARAYVACAKWDRWLVKNRMGEHGLIEMYCGFDTGHDHSGRLVDMKYPGRVSTEAADKPEGCPVAPLIAPDLNAIFYGDRMALSRMAKKLGRAEEAEAWERAAEDIREKMFEQCFDEKDVFFYDVDKNGNVRKIKSISVTAQFVERTLTQELADKIFDKYFRGVGEFNTPYPYPAVSSSDPLFVKNRPGNSWGYYSQGLTQLRTLRWMKQYGYEEEMHKNMRLWLNAWCVSELPFGQELDPFTGEPSSCSPYYSSTMLFYLYAARELGIWDGKE